jgi:hypothetical protein
MSKVKPAVAFLIAILAITPLLFFAGCNPAKSNLAVFNTHFEMHDYDNAALFAEKKIRTKGNPAGDDLLWALQLASVERLRQHYQKSTECFDKSEDMLKYYDEQSRLADAVGTTVVNDNVLPYRGQEYDGVMVNTYKALNFMAEGKNDLARVEFNRALDRQRRAKENFNVEIQKLQAQLDSKQQGESPTPRSLVEDPNTLNLLAEKYPNLYAFEAYPDFVNPFATYMAGLYFNLVGDHAKAVDLLKESYGMVRDNPYIGEDLIATEDVLNKKGRFKDVGWLIFENGLGPVKEEFRIDLPLFLATNKPRYFGIALPKLVSRNAAYPFLTVDVNGTAYQTRRIADMDRVIQTEFSKDFKGILTRAIISSTAKVAAQCALENQQNGSWAAALMAVYNLATTAADVRIWTTLPKDFQVARFQKPKTGKLTISPPGASSFDIGIPDCNNMVVYVKITSMEAVPLWEVMSF